MVTAAASTTFASANPCSSVGYPIREALAGQGVVVNEIDNTGNADGLAMSSPDLF
jgi:hypothetical protein